MKIRDDCIHCELRTSLYTVKANDHYRVESEIIQSPRYI